MAFFAVLARLSSASVPVSKRDLAAPSELEMSILATQGFLLSLGFIFYHCWHLAELNLITRNKRA
jgi:hypothetical protein